MICGNFVELDEFENMALEYGKNIEPKICDKCRNAIMWAREQIEKKEENE